MDSHCRIRSHCREGATCFRLRSGFSLACLFIILPLTSDMTMGQCAGIASTPAVASDCAAHGIPSGKIVTIDPTRAYSLAELIDIAEHNNPRTRILWEHAKQKAESLGIEKSAYFPLLAGIATFADQRTIEPFPDRKSVV